MIREATQAEISYFHETMYQDYLKELKHFGGGTGMTLGTMIYSICQENMKLFLFEVNGKEVGFALTEEVTSLSHPMLFIPEFFVYPEFRRKGIGTQAFKELTENLQTPLFFVVLRDNSAAVKFWELMVKDWHPAAPDYEQLEFAGKNILFCVENHEE